MMYTRRFFLSKLMGCSVAITLLNSVSHNNLIFKNEKYFFYTKNFFSMGTYGKICVLTKNKEYADVFVGKAMERIHYLAKILTKYTDLSDIGTLNKQRQNVLVADDTILVLKLSNILKNKTCNYFNIGVDSVYLDDVLNNRDSFIISNSAYNRVSLLDDSFLIDLGGIGKGFAVEEASKILIEQGVPIFFIELGGDVYVHSNLSENFLWQVSINFGQNSIGSTFNSEKKIFLKTGGISSSGFLNLNFKNKHIIDPTTLEYKNYYKYVTTVGENLSVCDALSTACYNVPPKYLDEFKNSFSNYSFYVFY